MRILSQILVLMSAVVGFVICQGSVSSIDDNIHSSSITRRPVSSHLKVTRRVLTPFILEQLRMNFTFRGQFCETCRLRNCQRKIILRRCSSETSKAKKCACCKFCPHKWRTLRSTVRPSSEVRKFDGLQDTISAIEKKLPQETARICQQHKVRCSSAQLCLLNIQNLPVCRCLPIEACGRGTAETVVCAANGSTYLSRCHLLVAACRQNDVLQPLKYGECKAGDTQELLEMQAWVPMRRKQLRRYRRKRIEKRRGKRRRYGDRLLRLIQLNQRERRRLFREMKRFRRLQKKRRARK